MSRVAKYPVKVPAGVEVRRAPDAVGAVCTRIMTIGCPTAAGSGARADEKWKKKVCPP